MFLCLISQIEQLEFLFQNANGTESLRAHRSQTPLCFYPNRAALSPPASLHFCYLRGTSSLSLSEHCLSWRDSIHLERKWQMLKKTQNQQPKKQQLFDFTQHSHKFLRKWLSSLKQTEQSKENGLCHLVLPFMTSQGCMLQGKTNFAWLCTQKATSSSWKYNERLLQSCRRNCISGCLISVSLSA